MKGLACKFKTLEGEILTLLLLFCILFYLCDGLEPVEIILIADLAVIVCRKLKKLIRIEIVILFDSNKYVAKVLFYCLLFNQGKYVMLS